MLLAGYPYPKHSVSRPSSWRSQSVLHAQVDSTHEAALRLRAAHCSTWMLARGGCTTRQPPSAANMAQQNIPKTVSLAAMWSVADSQPMQTASTSLELLTCNHFQLHILNARHCHLANASSRADEA